MQAGDWLFPNWLMLEWEERERKISVSLRVMKKGSHTVAEPAVIGSCLAWPWDNGSDQIPSNLIN